MLQVSCTVVFSPFVTSILISRVSFSVCSVPLVPELMETCIDDVLKAPGIPAAMADEAGASSTYAAPGTAGEDSLSLGGELTLALHSQQAAHPLLLEKSPSTR